MNSLLFYDISDEKTLANELGKLKRAIIALDLVVSKGLRTPYCNRLNRCRLLLHLRFGLRFDLHQSRCIAL